jgi:hypothetical protein
MKCCSVFRVQMYCTCSFESFGSIRNVTHKFDVLLNCYKKHCQCWKLQEITYTFYCVEYYGSSHSSRAVQVCLRRRVANIITSPNIRRRKVGMALYARNSISDTYYVNTHARAGSCHRSELKYLGTSWQHCKIVCKCACSSFGTGLRTTVSNHMDHCMYSDSKAETDVGPRRRLSEGTAMYDVY